MSLLFSTIAEAVAVPFPPDSEEPYPPSTVAFPENVPPLISTVLPLTILVAVAVEPALDAKAIASRLPDKDVKNSLPNDVKISLPYDVKFCLTFAPGSDN